MDLENIFEDLETLDANADDKKPILRAVFGYPGGKSRSVVEILKHLPYKEVYVEPFGGSAAVLLARDKSKLEVFNDRYAGVVSFYRCMRDEAKMLKMVEWLEDTVHSREDWIFCHDTWKDVDDDVERAARWYYMTQYSFGQIGRNFGRATFSGASPAGKIRNNIKMYPAIHERFKCVQVENQDWYDCIKDYDSKDTVFYLDPPYIETTGGTFKHTMNLDAHRSLLATIFNLKGFAAVSGYSNPLYEDQDWDNRFEWDSFCSIESKSFTEGNRKEHLKDVAGDRVNHTEVLWVKE